MKNVLTLCLLLLGFIGISTASFATGSRFGGSYGSTWVDGAGNAISSVENNIASSETYDIGETADQLTSEEVSDIESLIFLIVEKQRGTLHLTAKDVVKARNMQRTYMLATMMPKTGASIDSIMVTNTLPQQLPATGSNERNIVYLLLAFMGILGLTTTLVRKN